MQLYKLQQYVHSSRLHAVEETTAVNTSVHTVVQTTIVLAIKEFKKEIREMGHFYLKILCDMRPQKE